LKKPHALIGLLAAVGTAIGVFVAVVGLPYGRLNYTAFAGLYHDGVGNTPQAGHIAIDVVQGGGIDTSTVTSSGTHTVDVIFDDNAASGTIGAFQFEILNNASATIDAVADGAAFTGNPDFDEAGPGASGTWDCTLSAPSPEDDTGAGGPGTEVHRLACFVSAGSGPAYTMAVPTRLAHIDYTTGALGTATLSFLAGVLGDNGGVEVVNCDGADGDPMTTADSPCFGGTVEVVPTPTPTATETNTPTNTPTDTPTATPTPAGPTVNKVSEWCFLGAVNNGNADCANDAANLFLCVGVCAGPGEGNLIVHEYATNIDTAPIGAGGIGLGAYEFDIEYDNLIISALNPSDVVFSPANAVWPGGVDGVLDGEGIARTPANCSMSVILENVVHFGCVTNGGAPPNGPEGDMDLARLNLIPHEDLDNDIFPGNDNGVVTVIKDNGCETVDVLGHPTLGSVGGGLTIECGDLAVTVRILEGDLNLDCQVNVQDQQLIAFRYGSFFGSLLYQQWYDLEPNLHDLDIDIKDLQKVFGRDGSTCQNPVPAQTPVDAVL
jgi:hypothetical protein